jgi:uncharacterized protein
VTQTNKMRKADKEITDRDELYRILDQALVVHLGMVDDGQPYVVPLNFARAGDDLLVHCAVEGRKLNCLRHDPRICVEVAHPIEVAGGGTACGWSCRYESVIGFGTGSVVTDDQDRRQALQAIMAKYSGRADWQFPAETMARTVVVRLRIDTFTGKHAPA